MERLIILAAAILLILTLALAQTQEKKSDKPGKVEQQNSNLTSSQDPYVIAPQAYKREFENEQVRVTRVRYEPREIIKSHDHPKLPTVYVYLSDSGPVRFTHTGEEKFVTVRPAVKSGGFRLGRAVNETHEVESLSDQPSAFLRVELKDLAVDGSTFRGRFPPETNQTTENSERIGFENQQLRIVRVTCSARSTCKLISQTSPYLLVALTSSELKTATNNAGLSNLKMESGQTIWVESGDRLRLENPGKTTVKFLRIELKVKSR